MHLSYFWWKQKKPYVTLFTDFCAVANDLVRLPGSWKEKTCEIKWGRLARKQVGGSMGYIEAQSGTVFVSPINTYQNATLTEEVLKNQEEKWLSTCYRFCQWPAPEPAQRAHKQDRHNSRNGGYTWNKSMFSCVPNPVWPLSPPNVLQ